MKKNIAVVFGGRSNEYEVSCWTAGSVLANLDRSKYDVTVTGVTVSGKWYIYNGDTALITNGEWENDGGNLVPCALSPSPHGEGGGIIALYPGEKFLFKRMDALLPLIHGAYGEDGSIQGAAKIAGVKCCGAGITGSLFSYDKSAAKLICSSVGIPQADFIALNSYDFETMSMNYITDIENRIGYPVFIKPSNAGSSVGISKARNRSGLVAAIAEAFKYDTKVLAEQYIEGKEIEVAVLGNDELTISVCGEIVPNSDFYDYDTKYRNETAEYHIPARITERTAETMRELAYRAYRAVGCTGFARVDFFVTSANEVILNEINTIPGFTKISMYPKLMAASGVPYGELLDKIIGLAQ